MQFKKLARMAAVSGAALTMMVSPALTSGAGATTLQPTTSTVAKAGANGSPTATIASPIRKHKRCARPRSKRFNVSYSPGRASTTFYFNNHCSHKSSIRVYYTTFHSVRHSKCYRFNARTSGRKRLWHHGGRVQQVQLLRSC